MTRFYKKRTSLASLRLPATKRDIQALARKTEAGFEQLVVTLGSVVRLMQKQQLAMRKASRPRRRAA